MRAGVIHSENGLVYEIVRFGESWWAMAWIPTGAPGDWHMREIGPFDTQKEAEDAANNDMEVDHG